VEEPAGSAFCCCVKRVLFVINVDTANGRELQLAGLFDPHHFKRDVWAMKRGDGIAGVDNSAVPLTMVRIEARPCPGGRARAPAWLPAKMEKGGDCGAAAAAAAAAGADA
jgi:hypothetical protein